MSDIGQRIIDGLTEFTEKLERGEPIPVTTVMICDECEGEGYVDDNGDYFCLGTAGKAIGGKRMKPHWLQTVLDVSAKERDNQGNLSLVWLLAFVAIIGVVLLMGVMG